MRISELKLNEITCTNNNFVFQVESLDSVTNKFINIVSMKAS